jgi:hypothetical protein
VPQEPMSDQDRYNLKERTRTDKNGQEQDEQKYSSLAEIIKKLEWTDWTDWTNWTDSTKECKDPQYCSRTVHSELKIHFTHHSNWWVNLINAADRRVGKKKENAKQKKSEWTEWTKWTE